MKRSRVYVNFKFLTNRKHFHPSPPKLNGRHLTDVIKLLGLCVSVNHTIKVLPAMRPRLARCSFTAEIRSNVERCHELFTKGSNPFVGAIWSKNYAIRELEHFDLLIALKLCRMKLKF